MISKEQIRIANEMLENKEKYINMAKQNEELKKMYKQFSLDFSKYRYTVMDEVMARVGYKKALQEHKKDPYIIGGAAQGIAGISTGIFAATSTALNNKKIDENRSYWKNEVFNTSIATNSLEENIINSIKKLSNKLNTIHSVKKYREEEIEKLYNKGIVLMQNIASYKNQKEATSIFESIENYKDAKILKEKAINKTSMAKQIQIALISSIIGGIMLLMSVMASEFTIALPLFLVAFLISEVSIQFNWKKLHENK